MSRDSEIAEIGRALKQHAKDEKAERRAYWEPFLKKAKAKCPTRRVVAMTQKTEYYWRITLNNGHMDFWPSSGKFLHIWDSRSGQENAHGRFDKHDNMINYIKETT